MNVWILCESCLNTIRYKLISKCFINLTKLIFQKYVKGLEKILVVVYFKFYDSLRREIFY